MLNSVVGKALLNATLTVVKREVKCLKEVSQIQSVVSYLTNLQCTHTHCCRPFFLKYDNIKGTIMLAWVKSIILFLFFLNLTVHTTHMDNKSKII